MALDPSYFFYSDGTITLTNGSDIATGQFTSWDPAVLPLDHVYPDDGRAGVGVIKEVLSATELQLGKAWTGPTLTDVPYYILRGPKHTDPRVYAVRVSEYLTRIKSIPTEIEEARDQALDIVLEAAGAAASLWNTRAAAASANIPTLVQYIRTAGYAAPGDGGGGLYKKVAAPSPARPWHFQSSDGAWWELAEQQPNVRQLGAKGDGVTDDVAAFQAAHDYLPATGGEILVPAGDFALGGTVTFTKAVRLLGVATGEGADRITVTTPTGDVFTCTGGGQYFTGLRFNAAVTRTGGAFIRFNAVSRVGVEKCFFMGYYIGVEVDGGSSEAVIDKCEFFDGTPGATAAGSCAIRLGETAYVGSVTIEKCYAKCQSTAAQCSYGFRARYVDVLNLVGNTVIQHTDCLSIAPTAGQTASLIHSSGNTWDTALNGIKIDTVGGGKVIRSVFHDVWMGAHTQSGVAIFASAGLVDGLVLSGPMINNTDCGINIDGANAKNIIVHSSQIAGNGLAGVRIAGGATNIRVRGNDIGALGDAAGNATGVTVGVGCTGELAGNKFTTNTASLSNAAPEFFVGDNQGLSWTAYTPTVTPVSGSLTAASATGRYKVEGETVSFDITVTVTTNGTAAGGLNVTLPFAAVGHVNASGRGTAVSGKMVQGFALNHSSMVIYNYDGSYPAANGEVIRLSGSYTKA